MTSPPPNEANGVRAGKENWRFLKVLSMSLLPNWGVGFSVISAFRFKGDYPLVPIGSFLKRNRQEAKIKDDQLYNQVTVRTNNKGVRLREGSPVLGKKILTKRQFQVSPGQFIMSKIDARNGAMGIVPTELDGAITTQDFLSYEIDRSRIDPQYLVLLTTTQPFVAYFQSLSSGTTNRQRLDENLFLNVKIPLPDLPVQKHLVDEYERKIKAAEEMEREAESLVQSMEHRILNDLGIQIQSRERRKGIQLIQFKDFNKWGVEFNLGYGKSESVLKSNIFPSQRLSTLVYINPSTLLLAKNQEVSFLPMACISDDYGEIIEHKIGTSDKSQGYTKFKEGDLLWAKITPCMENGKSAIACNLINGFGYGSTEYHVLRQKREDFLIEFLHLLLRLKIVRENAVSFFTGSSGQQRVPKSYLEDLIVPFPPIPKQKELVEFVGSSTQKIKKLKTDADINRKSSLQAFSQSIFH